MALSTLAGVALDRRLRGEREHEGVRAADASADEPAPPSTTERWCRPPDARPSWGLVGAMVSLVGVAGAGAAVLFLGLDPDLMLREEGFSVFAPILLVAQGLERLLEPFATRFKPTTEEKDALKRARERKVTAQLAVKAQAAAGAAPDDRSRALAAANEQEDAALVALRRTRNERALIWWAIASVAALLLSGLLGLGLLQAMATGPLDPSLGCIDVVLTGIVIGSGTKPLHDLISRLEKSKTNADPATKPTDQLPGTPPAPVTVPPAAGHRAGTTAQVP